MAPELQLIKHHTGILILATPETSDILQFKTRPGDVLVAEFRRVRNPAFHRPFFTLLNLGFAYWEPIGGAISSNERKLVTGYAKFLASYGGDEGALIDAAEQYLEQVTYRRVTNGISLCKSFDAYRSWVIVEAGHFDAIQLPDLTLKSILVASLSPTWTNSNFSNSIRPRSMSSGAGFCPGYSGTSAQLSTLTWNVSRTGEQQNDRFTEQQRACRGRA